MSPTEDVSPQADTPEFQSAVSKAVSEALAAATAPFEESIAKLQATNADLKTEKQAVAGQLKDFQSKFDGIDIDAMQRRLAEVDNDETRSLLAKGEYDKVYEKESSKLRAEHQSELDTFTAKVDAAIKDGDDARELATALQNTLVITVRDGGISQAFVATEADKTQLRSAQAIAKDTVLVKGEYLPVVSVDKDGQSVFRHSTSGEILQNATGNFGYKDWLRHLAEVENLPLYSKPNSHGNPKAISDSNPKGLVRSKMTDEQIDAYQKEHGTEAYLQLPRK